MKGSAAEKLPLIGHKVEEPLHCDVHCVERWCFVVVGVVVVIEGNCVHESKEKEVVVGPD